MTQPIPIRRVTSRPRLLDAFCCQGGASMGYHLAGFDVVGVALARRAMGVEWMNRDGIRECIPPAYTEWLGRGFLAALVLRTAA